MAVGQELQTESGKPQTAPVVTLLVNPEDGEKLTLAAADGKIHLALRNTVDMSRRESPSRLWLHHILRNGPGGVRGGPAGGRGQAGSAAGAGTV